MYPLEKPGQHTHLIIKNLLSSKKFSEIQIT